MVEQFMLTIDDTTYAIEFKGNQVLVNGYPMTIEWDEDNLKVNGTTHNVELVGDQALVDGIAYAFEVEWPTDDSGMSGGAGGGTVPAAEAGEGVVTAIMPGKIVRVDVREGDEVQAGQVVAILEAMKMENELSAPTSGIVKQIFVSPGTSVEQGQAVVQIE